MSTATNVKSSKEERQLATRITFVLGALNALHREGMKIAASDMEERARALANGLTPNARKALVAQIAECCGDRVAAIIA